MLFKNPLVLHVLFSDGYENYAYNGVQSITEGRNYGEC
jgi:hypothetical protein